VSGRRVGIHFLPGRQFLVPDPAEFGMSRDRHWKKQRTAQNLANTKVKRSLKKFQLFSKKGPPIMTEIKLFITYYSAADPGPHQSKN
jgi:hypothetical protein